MSRVGNQPITVPGKVEVSAELGMVTITGPQGALSQSVGRGISVEVIDGHVIVSRESDAKELRALHGLTRTLVANMVKGVTEGFEKTLDLVGVGYRVQESENGLVIQAGYSHPVEIHPLEGTTVVAEGNNRVHVRGIDKQRVGEMAARIRGIRPPNAYTGKGIRYLNEQVKVKPGKTAGRVR